MNADTLLTKLNDLLNQATHERSHYYVAGTILDCVAYILDHLSSEAEVRERERAAFVKCVTWMTEAGWLAYPADILVDAEAEALLRYGGEA